MRTALYTTKDERARLIAEANAQGERTLHDTHGVGPAGEDELTFETAVTTPDPRQERLRELLEVIRQGAATQAEVQEYIALRDGR